MMMMMTINDDNDEYDNFYGAAIQNVTIIIDNNNYMAP